MKFLLSTLSIILFLVTIITAILELKSVAGPSWFLPTLFLALSGASFIGQYFVSETFFYASSASLDIIDPSESEANSSKEESELSSALNDE